MESPIIRMTDRIKTALKDQQILVAAKADFAHTFVQLGVSLPDASTMANRVISQLELTENLEQTERDIFEWFKTAFVDGVPLTTVLDQKMSGRAQIIFDQVSSYFAGLEKGIRFVDFGCGDAQVTQLIYDKLGFEGVVGYDVKLYPALGTTVPVRPIVGHATGAADALYEAGLMTNVAHHEQDNEKLLQELSRILAPGARLVVIETVPVRNTKEAFEINFLNDYFYNRLFHQADVPVPGTYELSEDWPKRFRAVGFELDSGFTPNVIQLGYDQPTIRDWHVLYVFKKV